MNTTKTAQLLRSSSSENQAGTSTKKSSRTRDSTKRQSRPKRSSKTDVSHSEHELGEIDIQERRKSGKRKTARNVSSYDAELQFPVRLTSAKETKTAKSQRRLQSSVPETSTPQSEHRVYQGRVTRSRTAATAGRERVSKYFRELQEQSEEEGQQSSSFKKRKNSTSRLEKQTRQRSPERSQSTESSESDNTKRQMEMLLSSARPKRSKQTPVKAKNPPKATTSSNKQPVREVRSKKVVQPATATTSIKKRLSIQPTNLARI